MVEGCGGVELEGMRWLLNVGGEINVMRVGCFGRTRSKFRAREFRVDDGSCRTSVATSHRSLRASYKPLLFL